MKDRLLIAVDVDGVLLEKADDWPIEEMVRLVAALAYSGKVDVVVWSGGGKAYAEAICESLLVGPVWCYAKDKSIEFPPGSGQYRVPDVVIDDEPGWGKVQLIVQVAPESEQGG